MHPRVLRVLRVLRALTRPLATLLPLTICVALAAATLPAEATSVAEVKAFSRAKVALASIPYDYEKLGYEVVLMTARTGLLGATFTEDKRIEIYVRSTESAATLKRVIAYEIGHAVDMTWSTDASRTAWLKARGAKSSTRWLACSLCNEDKVGAGDFADVFALWATGQSTFTSKVAAKPTKAQLKALARTYFHVGQTPTSSHPSVPWPSQVDEPWPGERTPA